MREIRPRKTPNTATFYVVSTKAALIPHKRQCQFPGFGLMSYNNIYLTPLLKGTLIVFLCARNSKKFYMLLLDFLTRSSHTEIFFKKETTVKKFATVSGNHQRRSSVFLFPVN